LVNYDYSSTTLNDGERRRNTRFDNNHAASAGPALEGRPFSQPGQRPVRIHALQNLQQANQPLAVGVQKDEVAGAPEAIGQDMPEDQPQEIGAGQRSSLDRPDFAVLVAESDFAIRAGDYFTKSTHTD